jgi:hypothetical protein
LWRGCLTAQRTQRRTRRTWCVGGCGRGSPPARPGHTHTHTHTHTHPLSPPLSRPRSHTTPTQPQRDFLIELMEAKGDEATGELYAEEHAARERAEQQRRAAVPGLQNPYQVADADDL